MTTTISTTPPDIPLPAGAVFGDAWEGDDPQRVIMGPLRGITDTDATSMGERHGRTSTTL